MKRADVIIVTVMIAIGVITGVMYYPRLSDYGKSRQRYNQIREEYVEEENSETDTEGVNVTNIVTEQSETSVSESDSILETDIEKAEETEEIKITKTEMETETETERMDESNVTFPNAEYVEKVEDFDKILKEQNLDVKNLKKLKYIKVKHDKLKKENEDYIGWIYVPETDISYPVVKSKDNADYLHKAFDGSASNSGCIFRDANIDDITEEHIILYGHNMRDNSMFAQLKSYVDDKDFVKKHPVFWFLTEDRMMLYRIFSAHTAQPDDRLIFGSQVYDYRTRKKWLSAVEEMKKKSVFKSNMDIVFGDQVMTLSTCTKARVDRSVTHGKLIAYSGIK